MAILLQPTFWKELFNFNNRKNWLNLDQHIVKVINQNPSANIITVTKTISNSECLTAFTDPIELVQAPGPGKVLSMINGVYSYNQETVQFDATTWYVANPTAIYVSDSPFFWNTPGASEIAYMPNSSLFSQSPIFENEPIVFASNSDSTVGDGDYQITITYQILSV
jgi:hypothetical protein